MTSTPLHAWADAAASAEITEIDGRRVVGFRVAGGKHHGAIGVNGSATVERAVRLAGELHLPLVGELDTSGAELRDGVAALHAWGRLARELVQMSGVVPTLLAVTGACVSGPALALGLFDHVVMTEDAFAYVTGPDSVEDFTGVRVSAASSAVRRCTRSVPGSRRWSSPTISPPRDALAALLWYLPDHHLDDPARLESDDPRDRLCEVAATAVPRQSSARTTSAPWSKTSLDHDSFLELRPRYAPNLVTGYGSLGGRASRHRREPAHARAPERSTSRRRARRRVSWRRATRSICRSSRSSTRPASNRAATSSGAGMIRHGAELVHAYSAATVPRLCVVLRKAYGGAYIVMDSRGIGNDLCIAWPSAEIAVMGAAGAVAILNKGRTDPALVAEYQDAFENPYRAAERGFVDAVIEPAATRRVLVDDARDAGRQARLATGAPALQHAALRGTDTMLLADKRILITGVLNDASMAFHVAKRAQEEGAEIVLTSFGRAMSLTRRAARRLPSEPVIVELDVTDSAHLDALASEVGGHLDGVLHAIGFAPESCLGGGFLTAPWEDVAVALQVSAYSLEGAGGGVPADDDARREHRRPRLRQQPCRVAGLRLDGRGEGRVRIDRALPRPRSRAGRHPREPRRGRSDPHDRGTQHPGLRAVRRSLGPAGAARLERQRPLARRCRVRRPAVRPLPRDHRRGRSTSTAATTPSAPRTPRNCCESFLRYALISRTTVARASALRAISRTTVAGVSTATRRCRFLLWQG